MRSLLVAGVLLHAPLVHAELREKVVGLEFTTVMPQLDSGSATTFATTALGSRLWCAYGVTSEIYAVVRGTFWHIREAYVDGYRVESWGGEAVAGELRFSGEGYRIELGGKWKLVDGYNLAPYLEAYGGLQWSTYRNVDLRTEDGSLSGAVGEFAEGSLTASVGLSLDYRIANLLFVGASGFYTRVSDELYRQDMTVSILLAYYWF